MFQGLSITTEKPSFEKDVLEPLRAAQAAEEERKRVEAEKAAKDAEIARKAYLNATVGRIRAYGTYANDYTWGNCTRYVASRINVPNSMGNANNWGYVLGWKSEPAVGAIAWTTAGWAGHVAIVVETDGYNVRVEEMNYAGYNVISSRWTTASEWSGFIY